MRKRINKAIEDLNLEIAGGGTEGYFYFVSKSDGVPMEAESVYVSNMSHLSVERWREEALSALAENEESINRYK